MKTIAARSKPDYRAIADENGFLHRQFARNQLMVKMRKHLGYAHIPQKYAGVLNAFNRRYQFEGDYDFCFCP